MAHNEIEFPGNCSCAICRPVQSTVAAEWIAQQFHSVYEALAPYEGYRTRDESAVAWDDVAERGPMTSARAEDCGAVGRNGACCKARGHRGNHARPMLAWDEWGGICGVICPCGPNGEPLACGYQPDHEGFHSWGTLPTFTDDPGVLS